MIGPVSPGQAEAFARAVWADRLRVASHTRRCRSRRCQWWLCAGALSKVLVAVFTVLAVAALAGAVWLTLTGPPLSGATIAAGFLIALAGLLTWSVLELVRGAGR